MCICGRLAPLSVLLLMAQAAVAAPATPFARNSGPGRGAVQHLVTAPATAGGGLAPTTWGFVAHYSGTLYGTGYYPFRVDLTYAGTNSLYGYTFDYASNGFVNEIRAIYAFDVSGLAGGPNPVWSSFMFDTRERPAPGDSGLSAFAQINLVSSGNTHSLQGAALFLGNGAANLDVYDAEDFENATPFAAPELAFSGNNPLITTVAVTTDVVQVLDIDVSAAVGNDLGPGPAEIPALDTAGLAALVLLLAGVGTVMLRRRRT